ncbi:MAG TPA: branched-chain amino acid ABC transporter permease [Firmicutes bacterium]|nr:branched-chain amino acid ABC transporter permease [Bacillota bacterium]
MVFEQIINGLILGSTYSLIALGYTMVYGILEMINFAHGEIYMFGAFTGLWLTLTTNLPFVATFLLASLAAAALGFVIERVAYRPLRRSSRITVLISAIGVSIFLQNLMLIVAGPQTRDFPAKLSIVTWHLPGGVAFTSLQAYILLLVVVLMAGLQLLVQRTKIGQAMRAVAQDREVARLMGIPIDKVISFTFVLGSGLGAVAGIIIGVYFNSVDPLMGMLPGLKGFVAAVLGGIGSIPGAMLGGLILGFAEVAGTIYMSSYKDAIAFCFLVLILLIKPSGILGRSLQEKV